MRILLVRRGSIETVDGISTYILELSEELLRRGHEVYLLSGSTERKCKDLKEYLCRTFMVNSLPECFIVNMTDRTVLSPIKWLQILHKINIELKPDIIHANNAIPLHLINGISKIMTYHGLVALLSRRALHQLLRAYLNLTAQSYDEIIVPSEKLRIELKNIFFLPNISSKLLVIPIGIHRERFKAYRKELSDRFKAVLHVGTTENKNVLSVLYAIKLLLKRGIRVKLYIAGSWTQYLENSLSILSTEEREFVEHVGPLTRSSVASLLGRVRLLTLSSFYECFPISVVESMCCGTPVIVSQAIPQELVIHSVNGFRICNPMDYKSLAKYIEMLLQNDELWMKMNLNCLKLSEHYDISSIIERILKVYRTTHNDVIHEVL